MGTFGRLDMLTSQQRADIEGPLYVVLTSSGGYKLMILNKQGRGDYITAIESIHDFDLSDQLFSFSIQATMQIFGLWFLNIHEATTLHSCIANIRAHPQHQATPSKSIVSILKRAVAPDQNVVANVAEKVTLLDLFQSMKRCAQSNVSVIPRLSPAEFFSLLQHTLTADAQLLSQLTELFNSQLGL